MIVGQNSLLNQYVVTFYIKDLVDGQGLIYDSVRKAFVNTFINGGTGGVDRLGELLNVDDRVDNPLSLQNGQALVYNSFTSLWENQFIDYSDIANAPFVEVPPNEIIFGDSSGTGLTSDPELTFDPATDTLSTAILNSPSITTEVISSATSLTFSPGGSPRLVINSNGSISFSGSTGTTGQVLTSTGPNTPPTWQAKGGTGTVTSVSAAGTQGVTTNVTNPTSTPNITIGLGNITPISVAASGTVTGSNISGTNTGNQTITLTGDVTGSGTGSFPTTLSSTGVAANTYGNSTQIPQFTVDAKGRISNVTNVTITNGTNGTVTSVGAAGGSTGLSFTGTPITTSGTFILGGTLNVVSGGTNLTSLGLANQILGVNTDRSALEYKTVTAGTAISVVHSANAIAINNTGVTSAVAGVGISVSGATGVVTINNTGVTSIAAGANISITPAIGTGTVTINAAGGVSTFSAGNTGLTPSSAVSGPVTLAGTLLAANGGTGQSIYVVGDLLYASTTNTLSRLADVATGNALISGGVNILPAWGKIGLTTHVTGTLPIANGGTNLVGLGPANQILGVNNGVTGLEYKLVTQGTGISVSHSAGSIVITNTGVTSATAGTGIGIAGPATAITITNTGVTSIVAGTGISLSPVGGIGAVTVNSTTGTVTSVAAIGNNGITVSGSPITTTGTFTLGLGAITPTSITTSGNITVTAGTITAPNISGNNTGDQIITALGDVTGVSAGAPSTSLPLTLSNTGVVANTYGNGTQVPQFSVDAKGRILSATNVTITSGVAGLVETVVFHYSSGGAGNFTPSDVIFSKTAGVTVTVIDGPNCIATYAFTGKPNPPKSITFYGQNYSTNKFAVSGLPGPNAAQANINLDGGDTPALPSIVTGSFTSANVLTLQTTMSFVGASSTLGNRAWLVIVFGF